MTTPALNPFDPFETLEPFEPLRSNDSIDSYGALEPPAPEDPTEISIYTSDESTPKSASILYTLNQFQSDFIARRRIYSQNQASKAITSLNPLLTQLNTLVQSPSTPIGQREALQVTSKIFLILLQTVEYFDSDFSSLCEYSLSLIPSPQPTIRFFEQPILSLPAKPSPFLSDYYTPTGQKITTAYPQLWCNCGHYSAIHRRVGLGVNSTGTTPCSNPLCKCENFQPITRDKPLPFPLSQPTP